MNAPSQGQHNRPPVDLEKGERPQGRPTPLVTKGDSGDEGGEETTASMCLPTRMHGDSVAGMNVSKALRRAVEQCGLTRYEIAKRTGIAQSMLSRFVTAKRALSLDAVDRLAEFLKLELVERKSAPRKGR